MNKILETVYQTNLVQDADGNSINPFPISISRETGEVLYRIVKDCDCKQTLEVGMAYGLSSLFLCQAHEDRGTGSHIAIDPKQSSRFRSIGLLNVQRGKLDHRLRFLEQPSHVALPALLQEGVQLDFAFIDGMHLFDYALLDFFYVDLLLRVGGHVAFDDLWLPAMRRVIAFAASNRNYNVIRVSTKTKPLKHVARVVRRFAQNPFERDPGGVRFLPGNICVLQKTGEDNRNWGFHRDF